MSYMFSFSNNTTGNPIDLILDAKQALSAISLIFRGVKVPELTADDASGIHSLIDGVRETLESVAGELSRRSQEQPNGGLHAP